MSHQPDHLIYRWLQFLKIPVSKQFIRKKLLAHSDYPSLLSITDTLDELDIENAALVVDKEKLNEIPTPFLAHIAAKGGEFILVTDLKKLFKEYPDFEKQWDGVIVVAEKTERWTNEENAKRLIKEKKQKQLLLLTAISVIFLSVFSLSNQFAWHYLGLMITAIIGVVVAVLIAQHELGISNELTEQLCAAGKNTDCDAVMQSKGSKILNLSDTGIIYFSSLFLLLTISFFTRTIQSSTVILSLLSTCSLPVSFFSVYYQWRIVKKWCPLCLVTVGLLWVQFLLLLPEPFQSSFQNFLISPMLLTAFVFSIVAVLWLELIKPALQKNKELTDKNCPLQRFKNNPEIFKALLQQQRKVDIIPFENDLQLGNPSADLQIMVACNPYCGPCATAHKILHELVEKNNLGLTVRFAIKTENKEDKKFKAVEYILKALNNKTSDYKRKALHDWYRMMDFEQFKKRYPPNNSIEVSELLIQHEQWTVKSDIKGTPTIFINGNEMPKQYKGFDLKSILQNIHRSDAVKQEMYIDENDLVPV